MLTEFLVSALAAVGGVLLGQWIVDMFRGNR